MTNALPPMTEIWVYLSGSPLLALVFTLSAYLLGLSVYEKSQRHPLANPVLIAVIVVAVSITVLNMPYAKYFEGAQFVHFLLGTATVALAIPIYKGFESLRSRMGVLLLALIAGGITSIATAVGVAKFMRVDEALVRGLWAKSVTAPIAMGVAERIHASPTLTAIFAVSTGILGAVLGRFVLNACGIIPWWQRGFALGVASHGIGTSRAFSVHPQAGTYASLGMGLHGMVGAVLIPWAASFFYTNI
ncbi:MAG: LrgB family protein [Betaproteobacteria bacterium]|nr:LrgB family protein [Betaproteobacteria bacterium]NBT66379.1 LrgB family protein [Betaproteobacteria bacterium]NBY07583.1 LrgB family protein [Betaproteobacteria bacterium]